MNLKHRLAIGVSALGLAGAASGFAGAAAHPIYYPYHWGALVNPNRPVHHVGPFERPYRAPARSSSGTWSNLTASLPFKDGPDTSLLLTNGTVITHDYCTGTWYKLTPDAKGQYGGGTWSSIATMPSGYYPFFYASQILTDGRMIMNGGEYNSSNGSCGGGAWTNKGALYDPVANTWTSVSPPSGWSTIGDAQSIILPNGSYMLADCCDESQAIASITGTTVTWTSTGSGKNDDDDEEGWTALPDGKILTVDTWTVGSNYDDWELYDPSTGKWTTEGKTPNLLTTTSYRELGPAVLTPEGGGLVVQFSGNPSSGVNDVYNVSTGTWASGPTMKVGSTIYNCSDAPAALLPDGNVLVQASPGTFSSPSHFWELSSSGGPIFGNLSTSNGVTAAQVSDPSTAQYVSSYEGRLLELPTGQILWSNDGQTGHAQLSTYTPKGSPNSNWLPVVSSVSSTLTVGSTGNAISGTNFNGFSLGASYGDDAQMATNWPIVSITNTSSGDVCYARSYDFSTMGVWTSGTTNAVFDIPSGCATGASTLTVVVNGIASAGVSVTLN